MQTLHLTLPDDELAAWHAEAQRLARLANVDDADALPRLLRAVMAKHLATPVRSRGDIAESMREID